MKFNTNKGFTLIELLVVVAIIGILASVVLASLNSARIKGREAAIKSNLRNMMPQAELSHSDLGNYSGACAAVASMLSAITVAGGTSACYSYNVAGDVNTRWGASARLNSDSTKNWSVDATGVVAWDTADQSASSWAAANTACATAGGHLPSIEQFKALYDAYGTTPTGFTAGGYWSSTEIGGSAYYLSGSGAIFSSVKSTTRFVRCVR